MAAIVNDSLNEDARAAAGRSSFVAQDVRETLDVAQQVDHAVHAWAARLTGGLSPPALAAAWFDWAAHTAFSPGRALKHWSDLATTGRDIAAATARQASGGRTGDPIAVPDAQDHRFGDPAWSAFPFNVWSQSYLCVERACREATTDVPGVSPHNQKLVSFLAAQTLDALSPANFLPTNPVALTETARSHGANLVTGLSLAAEDAARLLANKRPESDFEVGRDLAVTPGKIVFRNDMFELIQYAPAGGRVRPEPVLITPAWIMKYYILDLRPQNSLVRYLVEAGYSVFMISWRNPDAADADVAFDDYRARGVMAAIDAVESIVPGEKIHLAGYCLGGTLAALTAAAMARDDDRRLASLTLFTAQVDFTDAGDITLFINESQVSFLESLMRSQGVLDAGQMAGAFQFLRANDLIWSRAVQAYLFGRRETPSDLMAWNADATRLPARMHSEYLRRLFLHNDLAEGRLLAGGRPVALSDIHIPIFAVGTDRDHVAPWRSAFKIQLLTDTETTFVLASGGHNAGIVSEPGHPHRSYRILCKLAQAHHLDPDSWVRAATPKQGSWWTAWSEWLDARSGAPAAPPAMGEALCDAPGLYVFQE